MTLPRVRSSSAAAMLALLLCLRAAPLRADTDGVWREEGPPRRWDHVSVVDPVTRRMYVFGGECGGGARAEVWCADLRTLPCNGSPVGPAWMRVPVVGDGPPPLVGMAGVYDPEGRRILLYGGRDSDTYRYSNDLWALTLDGVPTWNRFAGPPANGRAFHTMTYDPAHGTVIVFGGEVDYGQQVDDAWSLSLFPRLEWTSLGAAGGPPAPRERHTAVYDGARHRLVLFGGTTGTWPPGRADLWSLDLDGPPVWRALAPRGRLPAGRAGHVAVADPVGDRMIVFGGEGSRANGMLFSDTTWAFSFADTAWTAFCRRTGPVRRTSATAVVDPGGFAVLYGGEPWSQDDPLDLWTLPLDDSLAWCPADTVDGQGASAFAYDPALGAVTWWLGRDLWIWLPGGTWRRVVAEGDPPRPLGKACLVRDPLRDRLILADGYGQAWTLAWADGQPAWSVLSTGFPRPAVASASIAGVYDALRDRLLVFETSYPGTGGIASRTWALPLNDSRGRWTALHEPWDWHEPRAREQPSLVYDPLRDRLLVFGGMEVGGGVVVDFDDVWALALADTSLDCGLEPCMRWTPLPTRGGDAALRRHGAAACYDAARDRLVVVGGGRDLWMEERLRDAWALGLGDSTWQALAPAGGPTSFWLRGAMFPIPFLDAALLVSTEGALWNLAWTQELPSSVTVESVECGAAGPHVRWRAQGALDFVARVERSTAGGPWAAEGSLRPDASGRIEWRGAPGPAGARLGLRLSVMAAGQPWVYGTVYVDAPGAPRLRLDRPRPDPGPGRWTLAFELADARPARLELFDVTGRRVHATDLAGMAAGTHVGVALAPMPAPRPGLYWLRLSQGGHEVVRRVAVAR